MVFSEDQITRLSKSFQLIQPDLDEVVNVFYTKLFETAPQVRSMFAEDISKQKQQMFSALLLVAQNLGYITRLEEPLRKMGKSHAGYGIEESHFVLVRNSMVYALGHVAGDSWSSELSNDWGLALDVVSGYMIQGLNEAQSRAA